jgi:hypothetical protein
VGGVNGGGLSGRHDEESQPRQWQQTHEEARRLTAHRKAGSKQTQAGLGLKNLRSTKKQTQYLDGNTLSGKARTTVNPTAN